MSSERPWAPTAALPRAIGLVLVLSVASVIAGRVDLAVLATPFVLGTAWAVWRRPSGSPGVGVFGPDEYLVEGGELELDVTLTNAEATPYDFVLVHGEASPWLGLRRGREPLAVPAPPNEETRFALQGRALRWGWATYGPVRAYGVAGDGLFRGEEVVGEPVTLRIYPRTAPFEADDAMPRAAGLVGVHRSRRYGDGGELAGIRRFVPGDRLRRVDWRASLRARELHVAQTLSDRDAELVVLVDVLHEAGTSGGVDGEPSVLDQTVRAAAGISRHYLGRGDRVMLLEYGGRGRALRAGSGRRQYLAVLEWLLGVQSGERAYGPSAMVLGPYHVPSSALLVVLTPLLDRRSVEMLALLARTGRAVVAVDTLPEDVRPPHRSEWTDVAFRLWRLERRDTVRRLLEHGVPTVAWAGTGSLDDVLRDISRTAAAAR